MYVFSLNTSETSEGKSVGMSEKASFGESEGAHEA